MKKVLTLITFFCAIYSAQSQFIAPPPPPPGGSEIGGGDLIANVVEEELCPGENECRAVCPNLTDSCVYSVPVGNSGKFKVRDECKTYTNGSCKGVVFPLSIWSELSLLITFLIILLRLNPNFTLNRLPLLLK